MTKEQESLVRAILEIEGFGGDDPDTGYQVVEAMIACFRVDKVRLDRFLNDWNLVTETKQ